ncbi:hypothetical protein LRS05_16480 [Flavobacterium sp. J372]|uniref:hypothetical protein n=1 Tax=Flavobacterium sp. J372 TaxID=2898436 RepID=UPI0021509880|nr:hypothetical protein [Flavobacterium sp. J372]MCR5863600.1 hypothetical protein [Flavobacterium sp. J372]
MRTSLEAFLYKVDQNIAKSWIQQLPLATNLFVTTVNIPVGAVGMIVDAFQSNEIIENKQADLVVIAREHLRDPYFGIHGEMVEP